MHVASSSIRWGAIIRGLFLPLPGMLLLRKALILIGRYVLFLGQAMRWRGKIRVFAQRLVEEIWNLVVKSTWIVFVVSLFVGAVVTIQLAVKLEHPMLPAFMAGLATRDIILLEISSTMMGIILACKIGGSVASEIGTMRITEQIDAMDAMGVNSAAYLVFPKIVAAVLFFPLLTILSFIVAIVGGGLAGMGTGIVAPEDFIEGLQTFFTPSYIPYTLGKTMAYAFVITSIPPFWGYYVEGGALEVGRASTRGIVDATIAILIMNLVFTTLFFA